MAFLKSLKRVLNIAICVFGCLSPLYLFMVWAATQDIQKEYLSARLFIRFKTALPGWYVWDVRSCHGEWNTFGIGFDLILIFHILLFARFFVSHIGYESPDGTKEPTFGWKNPIP